MFTFLRNLFTRTSRRIFPQFAGENDDEQQTKPTTASLTEAAEYDTDVPAFSPNCFETTRHRMEVAVFEFQRRNTLSDVYDEDDDLETLWPSSDVSDCFHMPQPPARPKAPEPQLEDEPEVTCCCCPCLVPTARSIARLFESQSKADRRRERSRRQRQKILMSTTRRGVPRTYYDRVYLKEDN